MRPFKCQIVAPSSLNIGAGNICLAQIPLHYTPWMDIHIYLETGNLLPLLLPATRMRLARATYFLGKQEPMHKATHFIEQVIWSGILYRQGPDIEFCHGARDDFDKPNMVARFEDRQYLV